MAVVAIAYLSRAAWEFDFGPWGAQPVRVYEIESNGSYTFYDSGTYDGDAQPYGYNLSAPITPGSADPRAPISQRPAAVVRSDGATNLDTHKLIFANLPDMDYTGWTVSTGSNPGLGGVDGLFVSVTKFGESPYSLPATSVQAIATLPSFFSHPFSSFKNLLQFASAAASAPVIPPFWTDLTGAQETP